MKEFTFNWLDEPITYISRDDYNKKLYALRCDSSLQQIMTMHARKSGKFYDTWQHIVKEQTAELRVYRVSGGFEIARYKYMNSQLDVEEQNDGFTGAKCYETVDDMFKTVFGLSLERAYGSRKERAIFQEIKECVPIQPHYAEPCQVVEHGYKADVSSCFASQCLKALPTLKGCMRLPGRQKPTPEYPFAFYLKSHHHAIHGEYSSFQFGDTVYYNQYYTRVYNDFVMPSQDETLLCKASAYNLGNIMQRLYDDREAHPENKKIMNAAVGMFHCRNNPKLAHLAAVIIGRCVYDMTIKYPRILNREHNRIYLISTDSIMWSGKPSKATTTEKKLGNFVSEEENIKFCIRGANCYQYEREDGEVITRYSGQPKVARDELNLGDIFTMSSDDIKLDLIYYKDGYFLTGEELLKYRRKEIYSNGKGKNNNA